MRTIAIVNQKGGCGKTTTAINLAAIYAARGLRTLLVDMDPQSHCAVGLGVPEHRIEFTIGQALVADYSRGLDPSTLLWEAARNLRLAPSTMRLAAMEAPGGGLHELPDKDRRLAGLLAMLSDRFDRCLIDCPPTIGLLTFNALRASREALIPVETGYFALRGAEKQWSTIQRTIKHIGRPIACHLLPSIHNPDSALAKNILRTLRRQFAGQILPLEIREHESLREAASFGQPIIEYAPGSEAHQDFERLVDWLEEHAVKPPWEEATSAPDDVPVAAARAGAATSSDPPPPMPTVVVPPTGGGGRAGELARRVQGWGIAPTEPGPAAGKAAAEPASSISDPVAPAASEPASSVAVAAGPAPAPSREPVLVEAAEPEPDLDPALLRHRVQHLFGARETARGVLFVQPAEPGQVIHVAGDFNAWSASVTRLSHDRELGVVQAIVPMPPGQYRYRLVINGTWQADPYNERRHENEYGEANSLVTVTEAQAAR